MQRTAERYHDFSYGHRVYGHENKCRYIHGHNGRVKFVVAGDLDDVGRVLDFSEIGRRLCNWLEKNWDHRFIIYEDDPWARPLTLIDNTVVWLDRNPTAENLAQYLVEIVGPQQLQGTGVTLVRCEFSETLKCNGTYS